MDTLLLLLCCILLSLTASLPLDALVLTRNESEASKVNLLQDQLTIRGVDLKFKTLVVDEYSSFVLYLQVSIQRSGVKLLLLLPPLCDTVGSFVWLEVLHLPRFCYMERTSDIVLNQVYMYSKSGLTNINKSPLRDCFKEVTSAADTIATSMSNGLSRCKVQCLMYQVSSYLTDEEITSMIGHIISLVPVSERNFLLLCDGLCGRRFLTNVNKFNDRATAIRMMSSWLLLLTLEEFSVLQDIHLDLDNVATVVTPPVFPCCTQPEIETLVKTLLYKSSTREWSPAAYINSSCQMVMQGNIFPNQRFGFNERKLLVTTMELAPFSMKRIDDYNRTRFEGISLDLLKELSTVLNFTYEVIQPNDMEWGRKLNGSWTGVVGLLEKMGDILKTNFENFNAFGRQTVSVTCGDVIVSHVPSEQSKFCKGVLYWWCYWS